MEPRIVAHRGASHDAPENTLAAFKLAWEQGADGIEGDFYLTSDREIVCIHDRDTERVAGKKLIVEQSTLSQLQELDVGSWKGKRFSNERPPTLKQVIDTVPAGKAIIIELKSKEKIVPVLMQQLSELAPPELDILIITFDGETAAQCKVLMPQYPVHWLTEIKRFANPDRIASRVREMKSDGVGMQGNTEVIDKPFIEKLQQNGCDEFHVWTIDNPNDAAYFRGLGAAGITTNKPAAIRKSLGL